MEARDHGEEGASGAEGSGGREESGGRRPHDQAWKAMFRCAPMMESLIRGFVEPALVAELDLSGLELRQGEFLAADARTLRADLVWRVPLRGRGVFLYFSVEIQSAPDAEMPVRMSEYAGRPRRRIRASFPPDGCRRPIPS